MYVDMYMYVYVYMWGVIMREETQVLSKGQIKESFGHTSFDSREALKKS